MPRLSLPLFCALALAAPQLAAAALPKPIPSASAPRSNTVAPLARVFAAVRPASGRFTARQIQVKPGEGKAVRKVTVRVVRLGDGAEVKKIVGTPTRDAPIKYTMPANGDSGGADVQMGKDQYMITVTPEADSLAMGGNVSVLPGDFEICRVGAIKWFDGAEVLDSKGVWLNKRPETDPWPTPDPESNCR